MGGGGLDTPWFQGLPVAFIGGLASIEADRLARRSAEPGYCLLLFSGWLYHIHSPSQGTAGTVSCLYPGRSRVTELGTAASVPFLVISPDDINSASQS